MSPTEFDLRAALRDGEGDGVDVDRVVAGGRARRAQRRTRLLSTAAAVVVVAAAGTGGALIWGSNDSGGSGSGSSADLAQTNPAGGGRAASDNAVAPNPGAEPTGQRSAPSVHGSAAAKDAKVPCPTALPHQLLPGGGSPGQFGSGGRLFAEPVASMVVCSFGTTQQSGSGVTPARLVLTGEDATTLAASLENAAKTKSTDPCTAASSGRQLAIIGVTSGGTALKTVTTTVDVPTCTVRVTNGTAVRYEWTPPARLRQLLTALTPRIGGSIPNERPGSTNHGSPVR